MLVVASLLGVRLQRLRDGAYRWGLYNDSAVPSRFVETFVVELWAEHLRQHERVTVDRDIEKIVGFTHWPRVTDHYTLHLRSWGGAQEVTRSHLRQMEK
jgi:Transmembrane secretion effector